MKAVIQRVKRTSLSVDGRLVSEIPFGLAVYLGVKSGDTDAMPAAMAKKIAALRIFEDDNGKMNLSVKDVGGEILLISLAERPERANALYERTAQELKAYGIPVKTGIFGADMKIEQFNDGPVTIIYEI